MEIYCDTLAGVKFADSQLAKLEAGMGLLLVPEPSNIYDPRAIRVQTADGIKLGYIKKKDTSILHAVHESGRKINTFIRSYNPDLQPWEQIVIVCYADDKPVEKEEAL